MIFSIRCSSPIYTLITGATWPRSGPVDGAGRTGPLRVWGPSGASEDMGNAYAVEHFLKADNWDAKTRNFILKKKPGLAPGLLRLASGVFSRFGVPVEVPVTMIFENGAPEGIIRRLGRLTPTGPPSLRDDVLSPSVVALRAPPS